jgi:phosphate transport system substrate-binding protein
VAGACGSSSKSGGSSPSTTPGATSGSADLSSLHASLNGSGSTFQQSFNQAVIAAFQQKATGVTITYGGGGSGKGKTDLQNKVVDFAGTDSLVKEADLPKYASGGGILYFPTVAAPITVSYNVSGLDTLKLDGETLGKIFSTTIKTWNDPAIAALNPGVNLPSKNIVVVHRADASGTTSNFSKYLTLAAPNSWKLGTSDTINWPSGTQAGQGNTGVATIIKQTDGAIGYVDYADAKASGLKFAQVKNKAGTFEAPTLDGAAAAVAGATIAADLTYSPLDASGANVYPITSPTWIIVYKNQTDAAKGNALKAFLNFALTDGQQLANSVNFAPLPSDLASKAIAQLSQLKIG